MNAMSRAAAGSFGPEILNARAAVYAAAAAVADVRSGAAFDRRVRRVLHSRTCVLVDDGKN